jgi:hypothetical protein
MAENTWLKKYVKHLEGKKILKTGVNKEGFPFFILDDGSEIEVSRDEEGNGPGFLFGLPSPK